MHTRVVVTEHELVASVAGSSHHHLPTGTGVIAAGLAGDPPHADELTNAIGAVMDHLDDVVLAHPEVLGAPTTIAGPLLPTLADVELGATATLPVTLRRDALEEVFRTVATEPRRDRRHNPGLPPDQLDAIVAISCVTVGVMRRLRLEEITIEGPGDPAVER